jgi:hypothetical protein
MSRQWDDEGESAVVDAAIRVMVISYSIERMLKGLRESASLVLRRVGRPDSVSGVAGISCAGEFAWNTPEALTHEVAPPEDGFASRDEPPSRPLP